MENDRPDAKCVINSVSTFRPMSFDTPKMDLARIVLLGAAGFISTAFSSIGWSWPRSILYAMPFSSSTVHSLFVPEIDLIECSKWKWRN